MAGAGVLVLPFRGYKSSYGTSLSVQQSTVGDFCEGIEPKKYDRR